MSLAAWLSQAGLPTTPPAHHHHHHQQQGASLRIQYKGSLPEGTFLLGRIRGHFYFGLTALGKERTKTEFGDLLGGAGFELDRVIDTRSNIYLLEASVV